MSRISKTIQEFQGKVYQLQCNYSVELHYPSLEQDQVLQTKLLEPTACVLPNITSQNLVGQ